VLTWGGDSRELLVCGGGAFNSHLMDRLQRALPSVVVTGTEARGLPPLQVEAAAFAWLARQDADAEHQATCKASRAPEAPVCWVRFTRLEAGRPASGRRNWSHSRRWSWHWDS